MDERVQGVAISVEALPSQLRTPQAAAFHLHAHAQARQTVCSLPFFPRLGSTVDSRFVQSGLSGCVAVKGLGLVFAGGVSICEVQTCLP